MQDIEIVSKNILNEIGNTYLINIKDIKNYLENKIGGTEIYLKIKHSKSFKDYSKEKFKLFLQKCEKVDKKSFIFKFEDFKYEITNDYKAFIIRNNKRIYEIFFDKNADNLLDLFGEENSRLAETYILAKNLDLRDFLFKNDGRGLNLI